MSAQPLRALTSIKVKLGALVAASVVAAVLLTVLGSAAGVSPWLTVPVSVALALALTQLLAAGMVQPLRDMTRRAVRMSAGDYSGRVHAQGADEVGQLAAAFNQMADDLASVDGQRRELIATVSHELRTPLTALTAQLENLVDGVTPADERHLTAALEQAERLRGLVADLLDLSRLEAGVTSLRLAEVRVAEAVGAAVAEVAAAGRQAEYAVQVPDALVVAADPARLRQLLVNVLDNAGRHAPPGTPVVVSAAAVGERWWLEVHDAGPGVARMQRERVFQRFGTDPGGGGTGLGLAIARWVAQLHGGTLHFLDPLEPAGGARLRLELPRHPDQSAPPDQLSHPLAEETPMPETPMPAVSNGPVVAAVTQPPGGLDALFGRFWPERPGSAGLPVVLASALVGVLAAVAIAFSGPGLGWGLTLASAAVAAWATARFRRDRLVLLGTGLGLLCLLPMVLLDDAGIAMLCLLAGVALFLVVVARGRSVSSMLLAWLAWPLASLRGLPWFGRSLRLAGAQRGHRAAIVRTVALSALALGVFGALFASADAVFASWTDSLVPDVTFGSMVARIFVGCAVFALSLAASYAAHNPARVDVLDRAPRPLRNRFEWLVPVLLVDAVFAVFLLSQLTAFFGGHDYVEDTTGLTYADYVHQGFGQLALATALTLLVVWAAARKAGRTPADRRWLTISLGLLGALTLVVVGSALHRMHLYQQAYGFTVLRLVVDVFEGWLGVVVLSVLVLGVLGRGRWVPLTALVLGVIATLGLAAMNPDAWVADRNIDRFEASGRLDLAYLQSLSADAAPTIRERLPQDLATCALAYLPRNQLAEDRRGLWDWSLGRERARDSVEGLDVPTSASMSMDGGRDPCGPLLAQHSGESGSRMG